MARCLLSQVLTGILTTKGASETLADLWSLLQDYGCVIVGAPAKLKWILKDVHTELQSGRHTSRAKRARDTESASAERDAE